MAKAPRVAILLGSKSDEGHLKATTDLLDRFQIDWELKVISAHRQPEQLHEYVRAADAGGTLVFIAAAGLSAALPGVIGSISQKPVVGLPIPGGALAGVDALLSMVQMPGGIPVATVGVGSNGSKNAAILAAQIIALGDPKVAERLRAYREELRTG
ncbi:MAG TPA: 5-(carboxyamino)imidazole ribonucleotide mutase [Candidatus Krumholzibacteria bacterium]|nr:5-(carboxyamino)imidazole ribonucleotide mutase [Candidatus Krumholzibacteria bacterium]